MLYDTTQNQPVRLDYTASGTYDNFQTATSCKELSSTMDGTDDHDIKLLELNVTVQTWAIFCVTDP